MQETRVFSIRYTGESQMKDYHKVEQLAKENKSCVSNIGRLLISRGLTHTDNPGPLIKEKGAHQDHQDRIEKPISKVVSKDKPLQKFPLKSVGKDKLDKESHNGLIAFLGLVGLAIGAMIMVSRYKKKAANLVEETKEPELNDGRWWEAGLV